jgi:hypothetical protein
MSSERDDLAQVIRRADRDHTLSTGMLADAIYDAGYRKPRTITTVEQLTQLYALDIVLYDDSENGGPIKTYIVPDDGTMMFRHPAQFHFNDFAENYIYAKDMPLPVTVLRETS